MTTQTNPQTETAPTEATTAAARHQELMNANRILWQEIKELKEMIAALMMQQAPQPPATSVIAGQLSFKAEKMTATVDSGKAYWKVKGAHYQQYGVTIWPEVLEDAGFDVDELNPLKPVDLAGFVAICSVKENGQPKKVIRLETQS